MSSVQIFDYIIIGAGIAGASVAASLSRRASVALLEGEQHVGYHTTGRSAALLSTIYGNSVIRRLTRASQPFFLQPPAGFAPAPLVTPRPTLYFASQDQLATLDRFLADPDIASATDVLDAAQARALIPAFKPDYLARAALERDSADIDVDQLHQGFLRSMRSSGGKLFLSTRVHQIEKADADWTVSTNAGELRSRVLVNAAGAWGDEVAAMAGAARVGLQPMRRTALLVTPPADLDCSNWPAAIDIDEGFYFKPDAGMLLISPADETPSAPCDAQPEELDVAIAIDRFEQATVATVRKVTHKWAGLRVFSPDRTPVVGFDPKVEGFFWLVGQGGYGIQTAPAMGELAAALASNEEIPAELARMGVDARELSPARFMNAQTFKDGHG
jgi:D-arginine dehydrogenase